MTGNKKGINMKNITNTVGYIFTNLVLAAMGFALTGMFYSTEFAEGGVALFGMRSYITANVLYVAVYFLTALLNGIFLRTKLGYIGNICISLAIMNVIVLFSQAGLAGLYSIIATVLIYAFWAAINYFADKMPKSLFIEEVTEEDDMPGITDEPDEEPAQEKPRLSKRLYSVAVKMLILLLVVSSLFLAIFNILGSYHYGHSYNNLIYREIRIEKSDMEEISKLEKAEWKALSLDERIDILQRISELEADRMGLPVAPKINAVALGDEFYSNIYNVYYDSGTCRIDIAYDVVAHSNDGYDAVRALANGIYLAYEDGKQKIVDYVAASSGDISGYANLLEYKHYQYNDPYSIEVKAKEFSHLVKDEYWRKIHLYKVNPNALCFQTYSYLEDDIAETSVELKPIIYLNAPATDEEMLEFANANAIDLFYTRFGFERGIIFEYELVEGYEQYRYNKIVDESISSLEDVHETWHQYFSTTSDDTFINEVYKEKDNAVYFQYMPCSTPDLKFNFESVEHISDNTVVLTGTVIYRENSDPDNTTCTLLLENDVWMVEHINVDYIYMSKL